MLNKSTESKYYGFKLLIEMIILCCVLKAGSPTYHGYIAESNITLKG